MNETLIEIIEELKTKNQSLEKEIDRLFKRFDKLNNSLEIAFSSVIHLMNLIDKPEIYCKDESKRWHYAQRVFLNAQLEMLTAHYCMDCMVLCGNCDPGINAKSRIKHFLEITESFLKGEVVSNESNA